MDEMEGKVKDTARTSWLRCFKDKVGTFGTRVSSQEELENRIYKYYDEIDKIHRKF